MSQMTHEIPHGLTLEQATRAAHLALDEYLGKYAARGLEGRWSSETRAELSFASSGVHVQAVVDVLPSALRVEAHIPLMLRPFKAKAIAVIEREARKWIDKVKAEHNA